MRKIRIFLINGIILTSTSLLLRTIGVSFNVYISNKIGAESVGVYQLLMSVYMFAMTFALSGIHLACMRIVSEELACGFEQNLKKVVIKCMGFSLFFGSLACLILILTAPFISKTWLHNMVSCTPLYIIAISLPFVSISSALNGYFSAVRRVVKSASAQVFEQIIKVLFVSYLINLFMPSGIDFACISLVLGTTVSEALSFVVLFVFYLHDKRRYETGLSSKSKFTKRILKISVPVAITSWIRSGLSTLKQLLIPLRLEKSGLSCNSAISNYGMINGMVMPIILFPSTFINSFSNLLIPEFSYYNTRNETKSIVSIIRRIFKVILIFSIGILGIFWCFSDDFSILFYNKIELSGYIKILSPLIIFMYLDDIVDAILKGLDKQVSVMGINILDLVVSISFIYFLLPIYGINGYICVIFISELLNSLISTWKLLKITNFKIDYQKWIIKPIFAIIATIFVTRILPLRIDNSILELIIHIAVFIFIYLMILASIGCISREDISF